MHELSMQQQSAQTAVLQNTACTNCKCNVMRNCCRENNAQTTKTTRTNCVGCQWTVAKNQNTNCVGCRRLTRTNCVGCHSTSNHHAWPLIVLNMLGNAVTVDTPLTTIAPPSEARKGWPSASPNNVGDFIAVIKYCCTSFCSRAATTTGCFGRHPVSKPMWISLMLTLSPRPMTTGRTNASHIAWDACAQCAAKKKIILFA